MFRRTLNLILDKLCLILIVSIPFLFFDIYCHTLRLLFFFQCSVYLSMFLMCYHVFVEYVEHDFVINLVFISTLLFIYFSYAITKD